MDKVLNELKAAGYDYGVAIATKAEIEAGAACGQLSLILENEWIKFKGNIALKFLYGEWRLNVWERLFFKGKSWYL